MNMDDNETKARLWFDTVLPKITESLGRGFEDAQYDLSVPGDSFYLSCLYYANIRWPRRGSNTEKEEDSVKVIVKRPPQSEMMQLVLKTDTQFHNEIVFYREYAQRSKDYPQSIYLDEKPPCDSVIVLEDVTVQGFDLSPKKYGASLNYTLAAMREIGRFHAKGYIMKEREREKFFDIVSQLQESRYECTDDNLFQKFLDLIVPRAVDYLRTKNYDKDFCDKIDIFFSSTYENVMMKAVKPVEPLAVMCHGDFTLNNILFKGKDDNLKGMLIDFALLRYGSPTIDLSTFLCLCGARQLKEPEFEVVLRAYHDALTEYLAENDIVNDARYTYEAFFNDFKERGLFGFGIASFFLPVLMGHAILTPEDLIRKGPRVAAEICRQAGGEELSDILATILLDLKEIGCLDHVI